MGGVNKVILMGRLARDPEVRTTQAGKKMCNMTVATSVTWKDANGERRERTEFHRVVCWVEHSARFAEQYCRKGDMVSVIGANETRKWQDQSGQDRYSTEVVIRPFEGDFQKHERAQGGGGDGYREDDRGGGYRDDRGGDQGRGDHHHGGGRDLDDEIPF